MQAVLGFLGSLVSLTALAVTAAVGVTIIIILWAAGALDETVGLVGAIITGAFGVVGGFFGFLRELVAFARENAG